MWNFSHFAEAAASLGSQAFDKASAAGAVAWEYGAAAEKMVGTAASAVTDQIGEINIMKSVIESELIKSFIVHFIKYFLSIS
jgi:hypothetical protein